MLSYGNRAAAQEFLNGLLFNNIGDGMYRHDGDKILGGLVCF